MISQQGFELNSQLKAITSSLYFDIAQQEYKNISDEQLASLYVNERDDYAFNELVNRYGDKIYRLAMRITRSSQSAEEVLQRVFVILVEKLALFRGDSRLSTWIYSVSSNECFRYLREKNGSREYSLDELSDNQSGEDISRFQPESLNPDPEDRAINTELTDLLDNAINELPGKYRTVFQLRDVEEL